MPNSRAEDTESELVLEPWVNETHKYDVPGDVDGTPTDEYFVNEGWSVEVRHGDVMMLLMARNITQDGISSVDYQNNIHYTIGGKLYIAQFMIMELVFSIGGYEIHSPLSTCADFEVGHSETVYDGTVATLDCDISFKGIQVYSDGAYQVPSGTSSVDLTLVHHIRCDWSNTHMKIEALADFSDTRFYNPGDNNNEFAAGEPFTLMIGYMMMLANPEDFRTIGPVIPSGNTNTTLEYNMTLDNGSPLTVSKLEMRDSFTTYNATGEETSVGYSSMEVYGGQAHVTHGFPNMTYLDTQSMRSDPEIIIFHDLVTEGYRPGIGQYWLIIPVIGAAVAIGVIALLLRKRAKAK